MAIRGRSQPVRPIYGRPPALGAPGVLYGELAGFAQITTAAQTGPTGFGNLTGQAQTTLKATAAPTGFGGLSGSAALALAPTASLSGLGGLAGAASVAVGATGAGTRYANLAGQASITLAAAAAPTGYGGLSGVTTLVFTPVAAATALGGMAGSTSAALGASGLLTFALPEEIQGFARFGVGVSGVLTATGNLGGRVDLRLAPSAVVNGLANLAGSTASVRVAASAVGSRLAELAGFAAVGLRATAVPSGLGGMDGRIELKLEPVATLGALANLAGGQARVEFAARAVLFAAQAGDMQGTVRLSLGGQGTLVGPLAAADELWLSVDGGWYVVRVF